MKSKPKPTPHPSWHRGEDCNFSPTKLHFAQEPIRRFVLPGWIPPNPIIPKYARILTVGSCFAQHIVEYLRKSRVDLRVNKPLREGDQKINLFAFGAGFVNTFTIRKQFEWAMGVCDLEGRTLYVEDEKAERTHGFKGVSVLSTDDHTRLRTRRIIEATDAFIITLGLSEVWFERDSGEVFFGAIPEEEFNPKRHGFRVTSVEANRQNLKAIVNLLRKTHPDSPIIFTLSPVPLTATFRPVSSITANSVSKAILRVAIDETLRTTDDPNLFYWPGYEIVHDIIGPNAYKADRRHVTERTIELIMSLFEDYFIEPR